jgi:hypothetical protein
MTFVINSYYPNKFKLLLILMLFVMLCPLNLIVKSNGAETEINIEENIKPEVLISGDKHDLLSIGIEKGQSSDSYKLSFHYGATEPLSEDYSWDTLKTIIDTALANVNFKFNINYGRPTVSAVQREEYQPQEADNEVKPFPTVEKTERGHQDQPSKTSISYSEVISPKLKCEYDRRKAEEKTKIVNFAQAYIDERKVVLHNDTAAQSKANIKFQLLYESILKYCLLKAAFLIRSKKWGSRPFDLTLDYLAVYVDPVKHRFMTMFNSDLNEIKDILSQSGKNEAQVEMIMKAVNGEFIYENDDRMLEVLFNLLGLNYDTYKRQLSSSDPVLPPASASEKKVNLEKSSIPKVSRRKSSTAVSLLRMSKKSNSTKEVIVKPNKK